MSNMVTNGDWAWWVDEVVDARNEGIRIEPSRAEEIRHDVAGMADGRDFYQYEQVSLRPATDRLYRAVTDDIRRRDAKGASGWEGMRETRPVTVADCEATSSFRLSHAMLADLIGCDYDGYAVPGTSDGDPSGLASLAKELAEMMAMAYANVPARYYPLDMEGGIWTVADIQSHASIRGRLRIPLASMSLDEGDLGDGWDVSRFAQVVSNEWWSAFLSHRADEVDGGRLCPLPALLPARMVGRATDGVGTDGGVMLACAEAVRRWEAAKGGVGAMVADGDVIGLCHIIDGILGTLDDDTLLAGWDGTCIGD